ncbi:type II secretion system F family protein [Streptomyces sp. NPDC000594]|uniref:type II secretion system F family protein n=1 Tax=Streptomyces sp. NPDC000594 TaxID=3154261 RepID=UPI00331796E8
MTGAGTVVGVLLAAAWLGLTAAALRGRRRVRGRGESLLGVAARRRRRPDLVASFRPWAVPAGALFGVWVLVEGLPGFALGLLAAQGIRRRRGAGPVRERSGSPAADPRLPLAADLLAACLAAGAAPHEAADAVGGCLGGPLGDRLLRCHAALRLGGEPRAAWAALAEVPGAGELARCLERAHISGAPAADPVARLAQRLRADRTRAATARARRAQVLVTAPVGLCFLPAFLAVGVTPVVIGLAEGLLNGK